MPPSLEDAARRAAVLPADAQLSRLAHLVVEREHRYHRPVDRSASKRGASTTRRDTLAATSHLIRDFTYRVDATAAPRP